MKYKIISTGSQGNAVVINDIILIDCGVPFKALKSYYKGLKLVLLTHKHSDHINKQTIKKLAFERPSLRFGVCKWLVPILEECKVKNLDVLNTTSKFNYGMFKIEPFDLYHDVPNCGYKIYFEKEKLFYATDTNNLAGIEAKEFDLYMVECNYEDEEIQERIRVKQDAGEYAYECRAIHNHLSKAKCDDFIVSNAGPNSLYVYLHQHKEYQK